ncbi:cation diffusion facilitator family transporter [Marinoscillum furvescens]|uniref:Cobalt-zinc-cadmium efflux system protein n=1 Tax=Marinoscillum furvescens DSM 4134 TaxID=1122208 RepID=A0A3D9L0P7_MARFU|nr:cation diffusion facilitator family transporter [Marinoscillum furvescens]RED97023.1 cobalt-zinc-cadmium efflux system protein [Marinoscillum furvescens DSM 4134]
MGHHHTHQHSTSKIRVAFFINLLFSIVELVGGLYTNSVAILSDALHDFGDSLSLGVSWYFQKVSQKGRDINFSYGYRRFSILGAVVNSVVLIVGSIFIAIEAVPRLFNPTQPDAEGMIWLAIGGIIANGLAAWRLHGGQSLNEQAVYLHLLEDVLGWTATLIAAIVMHFQNVPILDPLLAVGIAIYILFNVAKNLKKAAKIILQGTPEEISPLRITSMLKSLPEVIDTHDCHIWSLDGQYHILSIHLVVKNTSLDKLAALKLKVKKLLSKEHIDHATIEFETDEEECEKL